MLSKHSLWPFLPFLRKCYQYFKTLLLLLLCRASFVCLNSYTTLTLLWTNKILIITQISRDTCISLYSAYELGINRSLLLIWKLSREEQGFPSTELMQNCDDRGYRDWKKLCFAKLRFLRKVAVILKWSPSGRDVHFVYVAPCWSWYLLRGSGWWKKMERDFNELILSVKFAQS